MAAFVGRLCGVRAVPATIIPYLNGTAFDPDLTHAMGQAYDRAFRALHDRGQPAMVHEVIAKRIIEIAKTGERDPNKLCERALQAFGIEAT
jgi:hypothetical protein